MGRLPRHGRGSMPLTNYGELDIVIDERTGTAKRVRGGVGGGAIERDSPQSLATRRPETFRGLRNSREPVTNPAPSPFRSKLEAAYAQYLHALMLGGDIKRYSYEPIRLNLAPKTTLTPDFLVILPNDLMEFHEVKGWAREDAMAKLKIAARLYPYWTFRLVNRFRGQWAIRQLPV